MKSSLAGFTGSLSTGNTVRTAAVSAAIANNNKNNTSAAAMPVGGQHAGSAAARPAMARVPSPEERRRAQRVLLRMPVLLHIAGRATPLSAETHTVSQNGAMILAAEQIAEGTKLAIVNPRTEKRIDVRVVRAAQLAQGGLLIPVEFSTASPNFWGIFFPPPATTS
jgi:hypothetical protein